MKVAFYFVFYFRIFNGYILGTFLIVVETGNGRVCMEGIKTIGNFKFSVSNNINRS